MFEPLTDDEMLQGSMRVFGKILGVDQCLIEGYCAEVKERGGDCFMSSMFENISDTEIAELKEIIRDIITTEYDYISADKGKRDQNQGMGEDIVFQLRGDEIKTLLDDRRYILSDKETEDVISLFCDLWEKSVCEVADNVIWRRRRGSRLRQPE